MAMGLISDWLGNNILSTLDQFWYLTNWCLLPFSCVCPVIDHELYQNIVKVAVDPGGNSRVGLQTTLTMLWWNSFSVTGQMHEKLTSICFFTVTNCQTVRSHVSVRYKLANERARICAVIVKIKIQLNTIPRPQHEVLGNKPHKLCSYIPQGLVLRSILLVWI